MLCLLIPTDLWHQHGDCREDTSHGLTTHKPRTIFWRKLSNQAKQTALKHGPKHWKQRSLEWSNHQELLCNAWVSIYLHFAIIWQDILLMNQMTAIVMLKKRSCSILTFTKVAVRMKSNKMKTILPAILIRSGILQSKTKRHHITHNPKRSETSFDLKVHINTECCPYCW